MSLPTGPVLARVEDAGAPPEERSSVDNSILSFGTPKRLSSRSAYLYQVIMTDDDGELRPDLLYTLNSSTHRSGMHPEEYDFEAEDDGFHCEDCDWKGVSVNLVGDDDYFGSECPDCGSRDVTNTLTKHLEQIEEIYEEAEKLDYGFVPYSHFEAEFEPPRDRLDEALTYLQPDQIYVVFDGGETLLHIDRH